MLTRKVKAGAFSPSYHCPFQQTVEVAQDGTTGFDMAQTVAKRIAEDEDWDESFFVCDIGQILERHEKFQKELPNVDIFYAAKANSLQPIISTLAALGCGFDCASKNEISLALNNGVRAEDIIFSHPCKFQSHIEFAKRHGVKTLVFDNEEELKKLKNYPEARLLLRIIIVDTVARNKFGDKFGANDEYAKVLLKTAWENQQNVVGVSFHVGSGCPSDSTFAAAIRNAKTIFDFASELGFKFSVLDIGGGFPGSDEEDAVMPFEKMTSAIRKSLGEHFPPECGVRFVAEPGRYFPGSACGLVTNVTGKKVTEDLVSYHVGDGVFNSFGNVLLEDIQASPIPLMPVANSQEHRPSIIYGVTCDGNDVIKKSVEMPEVESSSWIYWGEMGSYSAMTACGFNGFTTYKAYHFITQSKLKQLEKTAPFPSLLPQFTRNLNDAMQ